MTKSVLNGSKMESPPDFLVLDINVFALQAGLGFLGGDVPFVYVQFHPSTHRWTSRVTQLRLSDPPPNGPLNFLSELLAECNRFPPGAASVLMSSTLSDKARGPSCRAWPAPQIPVWFVVWVCIGGCV